MHENINKNEMIMGMLAFSPIFPCISSAVFGFSLAVILFIFLVLTTFSVYYIRHFMPLSQRFVTALIVTVSIAILMGMLVEARFYPLEEKIGLFFPLLFINSLILSVNESVFSSVKVNSVFKKVLIQGTFITIFFTVFGFFREFLGHLVLFSETNLLVDNIFHGFFLSNSELGFSIFNLPTGCFFLLGLLFFMINLIKQR